MNEWKEVVIGEHIDLISGYAFKSSDFLKEKLEDSLPVIKIKNVANGDVNLNDVDYYKYNSNLEKFILLEGDVLIAMTGNHPQAETQVVGDVSRYRLKVKSLLNQRVGKIIVKGNTNLDFIYYLFKNDDVRFYLANQSSGSANQANISKSDILGLNLLLPPLSEQKAIAAVLSAFDDKIELLREQNKTLEEMGQTIFNYEYTLMNNDLVKADEILDFEKGIEVGSNNYYESPSDLNNPEMFYRVGDISNNGNLSALYCEKELLKNKIFKSDSVLVSFDGTVGRVFIGGNGGYSSGIRKITATENNIKNSFLYFWAKTEETQETIKLYSEGTTIQHAGRSIPYLEIISNQETIDKIEEIIEPIFIKILYNLHQIQSLSRTRDELLPRLMCGELRVGGF